MDETKQSSEKTILKLRIPGESELREVTIPSRYTLEQRDSAVLRALAARYPQYENGALIDNGDGTHTPQAQAKKNG